MGDKKESEGTDENPFLLRANQLLHYFLKCSKNHSSKAAMKIMA